MSTCHFSFPDDMPEVVREALMAHDGVGIPWQTELTFTGEYRASSGTISVELSRGNVWLTWRLSAASTSTTCISVGPPRVFVSNILREHKKSLCIPVEQPSQSPQDLLMKVLRERNQEVHDLKWRIESTSETLEKTRAELKETKATLDESIGALAIFARVFRHLKKWDIQSLPHVEYQFRALDDHIYPVQETTYTMELFFSGDGEPAREDLLALVSSDAIKGYSK